MYNLQGQLKKTNSFSHRVVSYACFVCLLASSFTIKSAEQAIEPAYIKLLNRSDYPMTYAVWEDGSDCSYKMELPAEVDLNLPAPAKIVIPALQEVAIGVGITEMQGKTPVFCEHIVSFVPTAYEQYVMEYYVRDRRCFALLHRQNGDSFTPVLENSIEALMEKMPEFGWDQFEPGCM